MQSKSSGRCGASAASSPREKQPAPRRWKSGSRALKEISQYQKTGSLLIRRAQFARSVKEILMNGLPAGDQFHWQRAAIECLQEAVEAYIVRYLSDAHCMQRELS